MNEKLSDISFSTLSYKTGVDETTLKWLYELHQPIMLANLDGDVPFLNKQASKVLKWDLQDDFDLNFIDPSLKLKDQLKHFITNNDSEPSQRWFCKNGASFEPTYHLSVYHHDPLLISIFFEERTVTLSSSNSEYLIHELMNCTSEAIFIFDKDRSTVVNCNTRAIELFEFNSKEEVLRLDSNILRKHPLSESETENIWQQVDISGKWSAEIECITKNGREFWAFVEIARINGPDSLHQYLARLVDIDVKKKAEEHLRVMHKRFQDLVMYNQALICLHDMEGKILSINPASYKSLGYISDDELLGQNLKILFEHKNLDGYHQYIKRMNEVGESSGVMQVIGKHKKRMFWLYHNYKVSEPGSQPYVVGSAQDITDRVYAERELKKAKEFAEQSLKARELFLANVSHELRTPLHGILNVNNFLAKTNLSEEQYEFTQIINRSAENLLFLVNDILDVAKMESGKFELEVIPFDLKEELSKSTEAFHFSAQQKNIAFNVTLPEKPIAILLGDAQRLSQVVLNLLSNAIKFTDEGSVDFIVEIVSDSPEATIVEVKVRDTGIGIPEEKLQYIFQNYTQVHSTSSGKYGGTGLGLSICRKLIEAQKGYIYSLSTLGKGSEFGFIITYPKAHSGAVPQSRIKKDINFETFKGLKALLVEDNSVNQLICKFLLTQKEIAVDVADDGASALELATSRYYDFVLMDIILPDIKGTEVATIIRRMSDKRKAEVPIIALTANAMKGDSEDYLKVGMNGYLSKPYTEHDLFLKIADILGMSLETTTKEPVSDAEMHQHEDICDISVLKTMLGDDKLIGDYIKNYCIGNIVSEINVLKKICATKDPRTIHDTLNNIKIILVEIYNENLNQIVTQIEISLALGMEFSRLIPSLYRILAILEQIVAKLKLNYVKS